MTALELQQWTGYKGDNITVALRLLEVEGWISARSPRGPWCLAEGRQLPLMDESDLIGFGATTTTAIEEKKGDKLAAAVLRGLTPIKSESVVYEVHGVTFESNMAMCRKCNIGEPKASKISLLPWVSPEFIKAHVDSLYADQQIGLAILRIENNELPRTWLDDIPERPEKLDED